MQRTLVWRPKKLRLVGKSPVRCRGWERLGSYGHREASVFLTHPSHKLDHPFDWSWHPCVASHPSFLPCPLHDALFTASPFLPCVPATPRLFLLSCVASSVSACNPIGSCLDGSSPKPCRKWCGQGNGIPLTRVFAGSKPHRPPTLLRTSFVDCTNRSLS
jgi:hypothetical protein